MKITILTKKQWEELGDKSPQDIYFIREGGVAVGNNIYASLNEVADLSDYVLKEYGKGLSTNDYTDNAKNKLSGVETGAQVNKIESIKFNNVVKSIDGNKQIDLGTIDVSPFITSAAVDEKLNALIGTAPGNLDTLQEISALLGNSDDLTGSIIEAINGKTSQTDFDTLKDRIPVSGNLLTTANWNNTITIPTVPTDLSEFTDDTGVVPSGILTTTNWNNTISIPTVPTDLSEFTDDTGLIPADFLTKNNIFSAENNLNLAVQSDFDIYAKTDDLPANILTKDNIFNAENNLNLAKKSDLNGYLTSSALTGLATTSDLETLVSEYDYTPLIRNELTTLQVVTAGTVSNIVRDNMNDYALKSEVPNSAYYTSKATFDYYKTLFPKCIVFEPSGDSDTFDITETGVYHYTVSIDSTSDWCVSGSINISNTNKSITSTVCIDPEGPEFLNVGYSGGQLIADNGWKFVGVTLIKNL